jgi:hypothetical protein
MASLNATTSSGIVVTSDNTGTLQLQSAGTTAINIDASQRAAFVAGTAALPAITTSGDTNTGLFFPAADTIAFAEGGTEAMRIDSGGRVTMPLQPVFAVYDLTFATGTAGVGTGGNAISNVGSCYNSSNGRFTAPVSGNYLFNLSIQAFNSGSTTYIDVGLRVNNSLNIGSFPFGYGGTFNNHTQVNGMVITYLNVNDFAQIYAYYGARSGGQNTFNGFLIG